MDLVLLVIFRGPSCEISGVYASMCALCVSDVAEGEIQQKLNDRSEPCQ